MDDIIDLSPEPVLNARRATLNGREYVVANVTLLKQGVLRGSKGSLFYPFTEIEKQPGVWNGFPLTANHPMKDGKPISARTPIAWNQYSVGFVFNETTNTNNQSRDAEAWIDIEIANRVDNRIIPAVLSGKPINVSTGLFTSDEPAPNGATYNGVDYTHIARNYRPDHLAILIDDQGACSVKDGCGINVNSSTFPPEDNMRDQLVSWLTTNCNCWKDKKEILNNDKNFSEQELKDLKDNAEKSTLAVNTLKDIATTVKAPADTKIGDLSNLVKNATTLPKVDPKEPDEDDKKKKEAMKTNEEFKTNLLSTLKGLSDKEYLDNAPPAINSLVKTANSIVEERRIEVIKTLVANISDPEQKKAKILLLKDQNIETLNLMVSLLPITPITANKDANETFLANFFGNGGGPINQPTATYNRGDILRPSLSIAGDDEVETEVA